MSKRRPPASAAKTEQRKRFWQKITRDLVLFVAGLGLLFNEAIIRQGDPRESLLLIYAGMLGLPAILRADEMRRKINGNGGK